MRIEAKPDTGAFRPRDWESILIFGKEFNPAREKLIIFLDNVYDSHIAGRDGYKRFRDSGFQYEFCIDLADTMLSNDQHPMWAKIEKLSYKLF